jgi:ribosomal protein S8E
MCKGKKNCKFKVCRGDDGKFKLVNSKSHQCQSSEDGKFKKKDVITVPAKTKTKKK